MAILPFRCIETYLMHLHNGTLSNASRAVYLSIPPLLDNYIVTGTFAIINDTATDILVVRECLVRQLRLRDVNILKRFRISLHSIFK